MPYDYRAATIGSGLIDAVIRNRIDIIFARRYPSRIPLMFIDTSNLKLISHDCPAVETAAVRIIKQTYACRARRLLFISPFYGKSTVGCIVCGDPNVVEMETRPNDTLRRIETKIVHDAVPTDISAIYAGFFKIDRIRLPGRIGRKIVKSLKELQLVMVRRPDSPDHRAAAVVERAAV